MIRAIEYLNLDRKLYGEDDGDGFLREMREVSKVVEESGMDLRGRWRERDVESET